MDMYVKLDFLILTVTRTVLCFSGTKFFLCCLCAFYF